MKKLSKILACLLAAALLLTGIAFIASAEGEPLEATTADGQTVTYHDDLVAAITAAGEGGTVKLLKDYAAAADVSLTSKLTIDLGGKRLNMKGFTFTAKDGAELTVKNGRVTSDSGANGSGHYVFAATGANTTVSFDGVQVANEADVFSVTAGATVNVNGTFEGMRWEAKRRNFYIENATVNITNANMYCQYNNMIVMKGMNARLTVDNSTIEAGNRPIQLTTGYAADGTNQAMAEGEYHVKVTNSTLMSPTYALISTSPYTGTAKNDSNWFYWSTDNKTAYHWEEVTLAEGTDADAWLTELAAVTLSYDTRDTAKSVTLVPRKTDGTKYYELKEGLPYHFSEVLFENSHLVTKGAGAYIMEVSFLTPKVNGGAHTIRNNKIYSERHSMVNVEFNGCLVEAPKNAYQAHTSYTVLRNTVTVFTGVGATKDSAGIFSNGMFESYDSAFLYPVQVATTASDYHRMFSSGLGTTCFGAHNTFFSDYNNVKTVSIHGYANALSLYGNSGVVIDVDDAAPDLDKINSAIAAVNAKWGTSYSLPTKSLGYVQDFNSVLNFGTNEGWIVPGVKVTGAISSVSGSLRLTASQGAQNALYFGHYNTSLTLADVLGATDKYKSDAFEKLGYANKATALDDLSLIGVYAIDFDITSDAQTAFGIVAKDGTVAATLNIPAQNAGAHVSLVVKVDTGVGRLYIDGNFVSESDALLGEATELLGAKLALTSGTVLVDNIEIRHFDKSYTAADVLFTTEGSILAWSDSYCVAKNGEKRYASVSDAILEAKAGDTVEIMRETSTVLVINAPITVKFGTFGISYTSDNYIAVPSEDGQSITFQTPASDSYATIVWHDSETNPTTKYYPLGATPTYDGPVLKQYVNGEGVTVKFAGWATTPDADKTMVVEDFSYIKATDLDKTLNFYPVYYNDPIYCVEKSGVRVSEGYTWAELASAFAGASDGQVIKLLSDINVPTPNANSGQPTLKFPANKTVGFDFNGYKMIRDFGPVVNDEGAITGTRKGEGFNSNSGAHCYIFSSRPGGEFYGHGIFLQTAYANSYTYIGTGLNGEDYGENLTVYSAVAYNAKGGAELHINGTYLLLQGGYRALTLNEGAAVVTANKTVFVHQGNKVPFLYSPAGTADVTLNMTFTDCVFVGSGDQNLFLQCKTCELTEGSGATGTTIVFDSCDFFNLKMAVTQEAITADVTFTEGCSFNSLWEVSSGTALTLPTSARVEAMVNAIPNYKQIGVTPFNTSPYLTFKYDENGEVIKNDRYFNLSPTTVSVSPENACKVTWVAGDLELTEYWVKGEIPVCTNDSVLLQLALLSRPGGYRFEFEVNGPVSGDTTYVAKYTPSFDMRANLTIGESLDLNVYVPAGVGIYEATLNGVDFTIDANNYPTKTIDGQVYYVLTLKNVKPQDLVSTISLTASAKVIFTETDIRHEDIDKSFTLTEYVEAALISSDTSEEDKEILKALLAYVDAAAVYFGTDDADGYDELHTLVLQNPAETESDIAQAGSMAAVKSVVTGAALNLKGTPAFRFYIADASTPIVFSYTRFGAATTMTVTESDLKTDADGRKYVDVIVPIYEFGNTITVKVGELTGTYNLATYKASSVVTGNADLLALVEALAVYVTTAK